MKRSIKRLLRIPCMRLLVLLLMSLVVLVVVSLAVNNAQDKVRAKKAVVMAETIKPVEPEQIRTYFDVPLSKEVQDHIFNECEKANIPPAVVVAMIERESTYNRYKIGDDGRSFGLMQVQPKWHLQRMITLDCTNLFDPYQNITVGVDYLCEMLSKYGDMAKALTAYNKGNFSGNITNYAKGVLARAEELGGAENV